MGYSVRVSPSIKAQIAEFGKQAQFAAARALTQTAKDVQGALYREMSQSFDRPTPYTLNSLYVKPATKQALAAEVLPKTDTSGSGSPADKYLGPEIFGGDRKLKRLELRLQRVGLMKAGQYAVPGKGAQLDAYGNVSRGQITKILSQLGAMLDATSNAISQRTLGRLEKRKLLVSRGFGEKRRTVYSQYFVARSRKGGEPLGIYQVIGGGKVEPVLAFVAKPTYKVRLPWDQVADKVVAQRFDLNFSKAMEDALATARR